MNLHSPLTSPNRVIPNRRAKAMEEKIPLNASAPAEPQPAPCEMTVPLYASLTLPCGAKLTNRIAKSAMSEGIADLDNHSSARLETLYRRWAQSGAGLLFTGNIQVDPNHLERR